MTPDGIRRAADEDGIIYIFSVSVPVDMSAAAACDWSRRPVVVGLDGGDPAVGPGPVGVRPRITALRAPVGTRQAPRSTSSRPLEHAQDDRTGRAG